MPLNSCGDETFVRPTPCCQVMFDPLIARLRNFGHRPEWLIRIRTMTADTPTCSRC
jgi:hypothetical protein